MEHARRSPSSKPLIAILEDDEGLRRAIERLATAAGYRTVTFSSAKDVGIADGVAQARCLVADVQLPGTSGPAFYASLSSPRPPVVFVTAYDTAAARRSAYAVGASDWLTKPFLGSDLLAAIEKAIGDAR